MVTVRWYHSDSRGMAAAMTEAFARAKAREWSTDEASRAAFRALVLGALGTIANLGPLPVTVQGESATIGLARAETPDRRAWQDALLFAVLTLIAGPKKGDPRRFFGRVTADDMTLWTQDGAAVHGRLTPEAALGPLAVAGIAGLWLVGVGLVGHAVAWMHAQDVELAANQLATSHKQHTLAANLAAATQVVDRHLEREQEAGERIPWDPQELKLFDALVASIRDASGWQPPALETVKAGGKVLDAFGRAVKDVGAGVSLVPLALLAFAIWKLS